MNNLLAIDQGTSSSRAILFSNAGDILDTKQKELTLHYPQKGWVEQNPEDIWKYTLWAVQSILQDCEADSIAGIGITNQRETIIVWDKETGRPVYNAIVWQDRRTSEFCQKLKEGGHENNIRAKTGLLLDPYFSASKIAWVLDNVVGVRQDAEAGKLLCGTVDTFLLWRLTAGQSHATDITNASRTMLYNIVEQCWDAELLDLFNIPKSMLPDVHENTHDFGVTDKGIVGAEIKIGGIAGDQQAASIGQACFHEGMMKSTYGTGCFALMNIGAEFKESKNRLLTTVGYKINGEIVYALEGSIFVAGAAIQWLRDNLSFVETAPDSEKLAVSVDDNNGVYFVPAFTGLGAPYWDAEARAAIFGLSRETTKAHITRAALEAQAYQTLDLIEAFEQDSGQMLDILRVDGGLVQNEFMCQFLADMLDVTIEVPKVTETTALGAAYLAGLQSGIFHSLGDISKQWSLAKQYKPNINKAEREALYAGWKSAVKRLIAF